MRVGAERLHSRLGMQAQPRVLERHELVRRELQPEHWVRLPMPVNPAAPAVRLPVRCDGEAGGMSRCNRANTHILQPHDQARREL